MKERLQGLEDIPRFLNVTRCLIEHGVCTNITDSEGYTALHEAAFLGSQEILDLLLSSGCDVNVKTAKGETALQIAAELFIYSSLDSSMESQMNRLTIFSNLLNISNTLSLYNRTDYLLHASKVIVNLIARKKVRPEKRFNQEAYKDLFSQFKAIVKKTDNINIQDKDGNTALNLCFTRFFYGEKEITALVLELLEHGADIAMHNYAGESFYKFFNQKDSNEMMMMMTSEGRKCMQDIEAVLQIPASLQCLCIHAVYPYRDKLQHSPNLPKLIKKYLNIQ